MGKKPGDSDDRSGSGSTTRSSWHAARETSMLDSKRNAPGSTLWHDTVAGVPGIVLYVFLSLTTVIGAAVVGTLVVG